MEFLGGSVKLWVKHYLKKAIGSNQIFWKFSVSAWIQLNLHISFSSILKRKIWSETKFLSSFSHLSTFCWEFWPLKRTTSKISDEQLFSWYASFQTQPLNVFVLFIFSSFVLDCLEDLENKSATENKQTFLFINIKRNIKCWKFAVVHVLVGISFCFDILPCFAVISSSQITAFLHQEQHSVKTYDSFSYKKIWT